MARKNFSVTPAGAGVVIDDDTERNSDQFQIIANGRDQLAVEPVWGCVHASYILDGTEVENDEVYLCNIPANSVITGVHAAVVGADCDFGVVMGIATQAAPNTVVEFETIELDNTAAAASGIAVTLPEPVAADSFLLFSFGTVTDIGDAGDQLLFRIDYYTR